MDEYHKYMQRAFELALRGRGTVTPNPMVGCVITKNNEIIGEGWHRKYGEAHAEVNAVNSLQNKDLLDGATVYVSLEPCSHQGKTPPCANMLADLPVKTIVISVEDPNPEVAGKGIRILKDSGKTVITGILEQKGKDINHNFFCMMNKKRPYIILKWAETSDGFIAKDNFDSKWISNKISRKIVHKWRSETDAVLVGKNTALYDDPLLTTRDWSGKNPLRVVLDRHLELPESLKMFKDDQDLLIMNLEKSAKKDRKEWVKMDAKNEVSSVVNFLYQQNISSLLVEGGASVLNSFIRMNLWDECRIFRSGKAFQKGISAPEWPAPVDVTETLGSDKLFILKNQDNG